MLSLLICFPECGNMAFQIESTTFCPNGLAPRWTWWIHGIKDSRRFGVVGTDEQGRGLYLFRHDAKRKLEPEQLLGPDRFSMPPDLSKMEASRRLRAVLESLGWVAQAKHGA
jgi:hypothetical protein